MQTQLKPGTKIHATIRRWLDRTHGNSYFSARVYYLDNQDTWQEFIIPMEYGYGSQPEWEVMRHCVERGLIPDEGRKAFPSSDVFTFRDEGYGLKRYLFKLAEPERKRKNTIYQGDGFHISFNSRSAHVFGDVTTALVPADHSVFYILNGDHREKYMALMPDGFEACFAYFLSNQDKRNTFSDKPTNKE